MVWTPAVLKRLKAYHDKGLSTAEIGNKLGFSKNAVVGKINRLGWNVEAAPVKKTVKSAAPAKKVSKPAAKPAKVAPKKAEVAKKATARAETKPTPKTKVEAQKKADIKAKDSKKTATNAHQRAIQNALDLANLKPDQCRWPIGDTNSDSFHFCASKVHPGKSYCFEHCLQAYIFDNRSMPKKKDK